MSGKSRFSAAPKSKSRSQHPIFGSPPVLSGEDSAAYALLLETLYADLRPQDIVMEGYLHDIAYWIWEKKRWRRMKVCLIEVAHKSALTWVLAVPRHEGLSYIGGVVEIDGKSVQVDIKKIINPPMSAEESEKLKAFAAEAEKALEEARTEMTPKEKFEQIAADFQLTRDTAVTRAFLEKFDFVERFDRQIIAAENRCIAIYREIDRHRANIGSEWREKVRNIEDAESKVIRSKK